MRENQPTRRAMLGLLAAVPPALLIGCGKKEPDSCQDVGALSDADKTTRSALQYVDRGTLAGKECDKCNFWQPPKDPAQCGGCQLVKGPIHPKGYCTAFAPKT